MINNVEYDFIDLDLSNNNNIVLCGVKGISKYKVNDIVKFKNEYFNGDYVMVNGEIEKIDKNNNVLYVYVY